MRKSFPLFWRGAGVLSCAGLCLSAFAASAQMTPPPHGEGKPQMEAAGQASPPLPPLASAPAAPGSPPPADAQDTPPPFPSVNGKTEDEPPPPLQGARNESHAIAR